MENKKLNDFKGKSLGVRANKHPKDEADVAATKILMDLYTQEDGFHCPRCGQVITDGDKAVAHLADEINKSLALLSKPAVPLNTISGIGVERIRPGTTQHAEEET